MIPSPVDRVLADLASLKREPRLTSQMKDQIQTLQMELGFLKMYLWCLPRNSLGKPYIRATVGKGKLDLCRSGIRALDRGQFEDWDFAASKLLQKIKHCKPKMKENSLHLSDSSFPSKFSSRYVLRELVTSTHRNLKNLLRLNTDRVIAVKMQIRALTEKLKMVRDFFNSSAEVWFFTNYLHVWAYRITCLSLVYWLDAMEDAMPVKINDILNDQLQKVNSYISEVIGIHLRVLKASELSLFNRFEMVIIVEGFLNVFLPMGCMKILREPMIFLITFLMDPPKPKKYARDGILILTKAHAVAGEIPSLICSLTDGEFKEGIAKVRNVLLCAFQEKVDTIKTEVRNYYVRISVSSRFNFPKTNAMGFSVLLLKNLGNLKEMINLKANFLPFAKHQIVILYKELLSLWPFLKDIQEKQNVFEELKDLWKRIVDVTYQVENLIYSCQILDVPIWYCLIRLSDVIEEIKFIKREIQHIKDKQEYNIVVTNATIDSSSFHLVQADTSRLDGVVVGFEDEAKKVTDRLIRGSNNLDIVSIVGMAGQGKTTPVKKMYENLSIRYYFNKCAWCCITQVYNVEQLLLDILRDVTVLDDEMQNMSQEDLAHKLCRCLRGKRYFIIMDDIWDINAWKELKLSFPDDQNGSRILFTSRNEIVELQEEFGCNPHRLRSLSKDESLELLNQKLFPKDGCGPSEFVYEVERIVRMCNGLPLAIVVIAGLLNRASNDLNQWRQIVGKLNSQSASEECMGILELSYKNLPDSLKPCFLCLATVVKGKAFNVQKLIEVWTAGGFIQGTKTERLNDIAMKYLVDLISRSLVIVTKRSSSGEIKECRIHDLVHELCLAKAIEEKFIYFPDIRSHSSNPAVYEPFRTCSTEKLGTYIKSMPSAASVQSLFINHFSFSVENFPSVLITKLKFLQVLDMEGSKFHGYSLDKITSLTFLRYLAISSDVGALPSSIGNLCNLETFRLVRGNVKFTVWVPHTFWMMKRLRNVHIYRSAISSQHYAMEVSSELRNLERFSSIFLYSGYHAKRVLRRLPGARKLRLEFERYWCWGWNIDLFNVLNSLRMLESVSMYYDRVVGVLGSCSVNFPSTLKKLTLSKSLLPWSEISAIAKLPNLEVLKLLSNAFSGPQWDVEDDEFLNLKFLKLCGLEFSKWTASINSFPCLERLIVTDCKFLEEIPCSFREISTWKRIEIDGCAECVANSASSILREQQEMGNEDFEVVISNIYHPWTARWTFLPYPPYARPYRYSNWESERFQIPGVYYGNILLDRRIKIIITRYKLENWVPKTRDKHARRVNNRHKYNCQSRQAISNRHFRDLLKRDG